MKPLVPHVRTYVKDDWHFLRLIPTDLKYENVTLFSVDITSLYTNITLELGVEAITYWIRRLRHLIPMRFTEHFIIDSLEFVLTNNNFMFDDKFYHQIVGTAMGSKCAPPFACLTVAYLEESKLFPIILPNYFNILQQKWIEDNLKRYMDDGFLALLNTINISTFMKCLNMMHPKIQFTDERAKFVTQNGLKSQRLNFLDVTVILNQKNQIETDVYYKATNSHDYLNYNSSHPDHTKNNVPFNLAKRLICFVTNDKVLQSRLKELRTFLKQCDYPESVIEKGIYNAKLQGPAPKTSEKVIPLVTTNYANLKLNNVIRRKKHHIEHTPSNELKDTFKTCNFILSQRQPKNLLRILSPSQYPPETSNRNNPTNPISKCTDKRCKICKLYIQCVNSVVTATGKVWDIRCQMSCQSKNVIYFLTCNRCDGDVSYIGKTVNLRNRTNDHISSCRTGHGSDIFDNHVHNCTGNKPLEEPYFKLFLLLSTSEQALLTYESHFHKLGYDTMNR